MATYFITNEFLRDNSPILGNVDYKATTPFIKQAQKLHLEPICGTDLYNKLVLSNSSDELVGAYKTLVDDYLAPALVEWSIYEFLPFSWAKITDKSVSTSSSENATPLSKDDLIFIRSGVKNNAEYYSQRAIDYLKANSALFPEYYSNSTSDDIQPANTQYFGGLYIPKKKQSNNDFIYKYNG
jgi:hypothetical protein